MASDVDSFSYWNKGSCSRLGIILDIIFLVILYEHFIFIFRSRFNHQPFSLFIDQFQASNPPPSYGLNSIIAVQQGWR